MNEEEAAALKARIAELEAANARFTKLDKRRESLTEELKVFNEDATTYNADYEELYGRYEALNKQLKSRVFGEALQTFDIEDDVVHPHRFHHYKDVKKGKRGDSVEFEVLQKGAPFPIGDRCAKTKEKKLKNKMVVTRCTSDVCDLRDYLFFEKPKDEEVPKATALNVGDLMLGERPGFCTTHLRQHADGTMKMAEAYKTEFETNYKPLKVYNSEKKENILKATFHAVNKNQLPRNKFEHIWDVVDTYDNPGGKEEATPVARRTRKRKTVAGKSPKSADPKRPRTEEESDKDE